MSGWLPVHTVDGLLVQGVHKVARVLDGVLEVADGVRAAAFPPHALHGRFGVVLQLTQPGLVQTGRRICLRSVRTHLQDTFGHKTARVIRGIKTHTHTKNSE